MPVAEDATKASAATRSTTKTIATRAYPISARAQKHPNPHRTDERSPPWDNPAP